jgi:prephenate dehydrogenase
MFEGAVWVLTPSGSTADTTFSAVAAIVAELGADVVALPAERHDQVVAVISHVPHLTAATLMGLASVRVRGARRAAAPRRRRLPRHDTHRQRPAGIWLDICAENRAAILSALDELIGGLQGMRDVVHRDDRDELFRLLSHAREARANLPTRGTQPNELAEVRIPIPDRPGAAAEVFTLAAELGVNISSFEVVHSVEGNRGVAVVLVDVTMADMYRGGLIARGFRPAVQRLG